LSVVLKYSGRIHQKAIQHVELEFHGDKNTDKRKQQHSQQFAAAVAGIPNVRFLNCVALIVYCFNFRFRLGAEMRVFKLFKNGSTQEITLLRTSKLI